MLFCPLFSGSSGNAVFLEAGDVRLLIDAGLSGRTIEGALNAIGIDPASLNAILVTHEHSDHIKGVGVLSRKYRIPVYANDACWAAMEPCIGQVALGNIRVFRTESNFYIQDLNVLPFHTPHDSAEPVGYCFCHKGRKVSVMTDIGHVNERMLSVVEQSDLLLLEANHDVDMLKAGSYPYALKQRILSRNGHLSNEDAGLALCRLYDKGVNNVLLGHLSRENNNEALARLTIEQTLKQAQILDNMHIAFARRDGPCGLYRMQ